MTTTNTLTWHQTFSMLEFILDMSDLLIEDLFIAVLFLTAVEFMVVMSQMRPTSHVVLFRFRDLHLSRAPRMVLK
jgi:hypothetical protein